MTAHRRISLVFGALYLITFITSIAAALLYQPVLDDPQGYIAGDGSDNRIYLGALLELILIIANIGTAIVLISLLKRQHEILTFSYWQKRVLPVPLAHVAHEEEVSMPFGLRRVLEDV
jgi:hypothetical protein